jgi:hypothetical protein
MNKHFKDITRKFIHPERGLKDPQIMHPEREWLIGLALMVTLFLCSALWSVGVYIANRDVVVDEAAAEAEIAAVYRESVVKTALDTFEKKDAELKHLLSGASPSIPAVPEVASTTEVVLPEVIESSTDIATSTGG